MATTEEVITHDQSQFEYDYDTLRTTGVILAVVMFVGGILIALTAVQWRIGRLQRQKFRLRLYRQGEERRRASRPAGAQETEGERRWTAMKNRISAMFYRISIGPAHRSNFKVLTSTENTFFVRE